MTFLVARFAVASLPHWQPRQERKPIERSVGLLAWIVSGKPQKKCSVFICWPQVVLHQMVTGHRDYQITGDREL